MKTRSALVTLAAAAGMLIASSAAAHNHDNTILKTAKKAGSFNTLLAAVDAAGLTGALSGKGPFTVFAPSDDAFAKIPKVTLAKLLLPENRDQLTAILAFHVVPGKLAAEQVVDARRLATLEGTKAEVEVKGNTVTIAGSKVVKTDIKTSNGIIHVIENVILPDPNLLASLSDAKPSLLETAREAGQFSTLLAAIDAAGLMEALNGDGPFTVFAPTDDAFAKIPKKTLNSLLLPENREKLAAILKYHVVSGNVKAEKVLAKSSLTTLGGQDLKVRKRGGNAFVNNSQITATDIGTRNGTIHIISSVLLPDATVLAITAAMQRIETAINTGVPLYNHGNAKACAVIYETTTLAILAAPQDLPETSVKALRNALRESREQRSWDKRAWSLRDGLDAAIAGFTREMSLQKS